MLTKGSSTLGSSRIPVIGALAGAEKLNQDLTCATLQSKTLSNVAQVRWYGCFYKPTGDKDEVKTL